MIFIEGRRMCPALENPEHGLIHGNHFWEGENVSFSCKPGFSLTGSSDRHFSLNGTWTEENLSASYLVNMIKVMLSKYFVSSSASYLPSEIYGK